MFQFKVDLTCSLQERVQCL
uniref:Uncharacterized protein n=1 Tax=Anguilla anguilla TaxID=7936 RepID=A0A0E9TFC9_ANGAN